MKHAFAAIAFAVLAAGAPLPAVAEGRIMITNYVNDFEFAAGNIGCPKGPWGSAFIVDLNKLGDKMSVRDYAKLFELIEQYESHHGLRISSKSRVRDFTLVEDSIRTETTGPTDEIGTRLCNLVAGYVR